jgi:hypothetical protein
MGDAFFFPLGQLIQAFGADTFFETGTGYGLGVQTARIFPFRLIISVEILTAEVERLRPAFSADPRVKLVAGRSVDVMTQVLPQIPGNIIFWLDAHFPGAHHAQKGYEAEKDIDTRLPLERELSLIKQLRPDKRDVILIDDLRIYEQDKFEWGNMADFGQGSAAKYDSKFLYTIFADTHVPQRFLNHSGYFALIPKPLPGATPAPPDVPSPQQA